MKFFKPKSKSIIGIDIGTHSIKLVELTGSLGNPRVTAWGVADLPSGAFSENAIADNELIADVLNGLIVSSGATAKHAAVSVSSSHAITKVLSMPNDSSEAELEEQVSIEALHFIPYPIDEVNIDFVVLGPSAVNEQENEVLLVACRRRIVDDYIDLIEEVNLELKYVDIDTYALERVFRSKPSLMRNSDEPTAIFDIGYSSSHLVVLDANRILYSRHQNFGAIQLLNRIRKEYGVTAEEASQILMSAQPPGDFNSAVHSPFVDMLKQELERALQFFYSSSSFSKVDNIVLAGGISTLNGLSSDLEMKMRSKAVVLDPLEDVSINTSREAIAKSASGLSIAFGLSLRGLS